MKNIYNMAIGVTAFLALYGLVRKGQDQLEEDIKNIKRSIKQLKNSK